MKVERLDHIHINVKDMDKAVDFFEKVLGIKFMGELSAPQGSGWIERVGAVGQVGIALTQSTSPDSVIAKAIERRGEGVHAIAFKVSDLKQATKEMQDMGLRMVSWDETGRLRDALFHPKDTHGVLIDLC